MKVTQYKVLYKLSDTLEYVPGEILPISKEEWIKSVKRDLNKLLKRKSIKVSSLIPLGKDELYCHFFKCSNCKTSDIAIGYKYCPNCGVKLVNDIKNK